MIADVIAQIQQAVLASGAVKTARTDGLPAVLRTTELPASVVMPGRATWQEQAIGLLRSDRLYRVVIYVTPTTQGKAWDTGYSLCLDVLERVGKELMSDPTLGGTVDHMALTDDGVTVLALGEEQFWAVVFELTVTEK